MDIVLQFLLKLVELAERMGAFTAATIWAFFDIIFIIYIFYTSRQARIANDKVTDVRIAESQADTLMANALEKLAEEVREIRQKMPQEDGKHV